MGQIAEQPFHTLLYHSKPNHCVHLDHLGNKLFPGVCPSICDDVFYNRRARRPSKQYQVLVYHLYSIAFRNLDMGYGSAIAFILFAILLIVTVLQFKVVQQKVEY